MYYKNTLPPEMDEDLQAAHIVLWVKAGERSGSGRKGWSISEVAEAVATVRLWDAEARACSGEYAGEEPKELCEAASFIAERMRALHEAEARFHKAEREIAWISRQLGIMKH